MNRIFLTPFQIQAIYIHIISYINRLTSYIIELTPINIIRSLGCAVRNMFLCHHIFGSMCIARVIQLGRHRVWETNVGYKLNYGLRNKMYVEYVLTINHRTPVCGLNNFCHLTFCLWKYLSIWVKRQNLRREVSVTRKSVLIRIPSTQESEPWPREPQE